jgi:hypothetical protein
VGIRVLTRDGATALYRVTRKWSTIAMSDEQTLEVPIACTLSDPERARRTAALETETFAAVLEAEELPDGYAFRFPADAVWVTHLATFIGEERHCCPFFTFELVVEPAEGPIWLRLRGREGVKDFIAEQFLGGLPG